MKVPIKNFMALETSGGIVLMLAAALAMLIANSPVAGDFQDFVRNYMAHPVNDALMVIFFLLIGLEIKREIVQGELSTRRQAMLPVIGALGGVVVPAVIYSSLNWGTDAMRGWAVPCATDIAFSLGVLSLFGARIPAALKIFLMALAVIDDLVAVLIIAIFYTSELSLPALGLAFGVVMALYTMARLRIYTLIPYLLAGILLWWLVLQSGVHATVAGVILGLMIPVTPGKKCIHGLHPWTTFIIMPVFALANAGVPLAGVTQAALAHPVPLGIMLGLLIGKPLGIASFSWLAVRLRCASLPEHTGWPAFVAVASIAGIGFTMSLFMGLLAFDDHAAQDMVRTGVIVGSLISAMVGSFILWIATRRKIAES